MGGEAVTCRQVHGGLRGSSQPALLTIHLRFSANGSCTIFKQQRLRTVVLQLSIWVGDFEPACTGGEETLPPTARKADTANQDSEEFQLPRISQQQQGGGNSFTLFLPLVKGDSSSAAFLSCPQLPHQTRYCRHQILGGRSSSSCWYPLGQR